MSISTNTANPTNPAGESPAELVPSSTPANQPVVPNKEAAPAEKGAKPV